MRIKTIIRFALSFAAIFYTATIFAQTIDTTGISTPVFEDGTNITEMLKVYHVLYGALVLIWGYVAKFFNLKLGKSKLVFTVLAGGIVLAGAFVAIGWTSLFPLLFSFLAAIGVYDFFLKPAGFVIKQTYKK